MGRAINPQKIGPK